MSVVLEPTNNNQNQQILPQNQNQSPTQGSSSSLPQTNQELANLIGIKSLKMLTWLGKTKSEHYSKLFIRKKGKNGKLRTLHNPDKLMRVAQYKVYNHILDKIGVPEYIHAFEKNKSIPSMAKKHTGKKIVISMDIKDFFHSIKQTFLLGMFREIGFGEKPARTLSELCTYKAFVPQGAITSPKLSNIVAARTFGPAIKQYCDAHGLILTIYADDITISSDNEQLEINEVISVVSRFVNTAGFRVNTRKTKVMFKHNRQYVCGVVVNEKTNLIRKERLKLRAMVHNLQVNGPEVEAEKSQTTTNNYISVLRGKLNWFSQLNQIQGQRLVNQMGVALAMHKIKPEEYGLEVPAELHERMTEPLPSISMVMPPMQASVGSLTAN